MKNKIVIGITNCHKWERYADWIKGNDEAIEIIHLSVKDDNASEADRCDGIVMTGGQDVHPRFYNKTEYLKQYPLEDDIDEKRDVFELDVIGRSQKNDIPLFGICRGLQIANVYFGGTLIPDIPIVVNTNEHPKQNGKDGEHLIEVVDDTLLREIVKAGGGMVNSAHHQSADLIGEELRMSSFSREGVVESLEWKSPEGKPFLLLVQWHPERMQNPESNFSKNIRKYFLEQASAGSERPLKIV